MAKDERDVHEENTRLRAENFAQALMLAYDEGGKAHMCATAVKLYEQALRQEIIPEHVIAQIVRDIPQGFADARIR